MKQRIKPGDIYEVSGINYQLWWFTHSFEDGYAKICCVQTRGAVANRVGEWASLSVFDQHVVVRGLPDLEAAIAYASLTG